MYNAFEIDQSEAFQLLEADEAANCGALYNLREFGFGWALRCGRALASCSAQPFPMLHISPCSPNELDALVTALKTLRRNVCIAEVPSPDMAEAVGAIARALGKKAGEPLVCNKYFYPRELGKIEPAALSDGYFLRPLTLQDIPYLMRYSKYVDLDGEGYVTQCVQKGPALGIEAPDGLAAWSYRHDDGSIGCLNSREHHRRKGLARAVAAAMVNTVLDSGDLPCVQIEPSNKASAALAQSLGFVRKGSVVWIWFES